VHTYPFADLELARRLERAEATSSARFVELRAGLDPGRGACWIEVGGTYAMYDGPSSPVTQTFGLGMFQAPTTDDFDRLEQFFFDRGAPADHEVSPQADPATLPLLTERGYRPIEFTSVMFRPVDVGPAEAGHYVPSRDGDHAATDRDATHVRNPTDVRSVRLQPDLHVRVIGAGEVDVWAKTASAGWGAADGDFMLDVARVNAGAPDGPLFLAELDGRPIATAALAIHAGVAHFAGASTMPEGRRNGAQLALLDARMRHAAAHGCDLALMGAAPGSGSQRNAERHGFRIAYTRIKWRLGKVKS
jgi:Acetyltransferase (GNAT) domain